MADPDFGKGYEDGKRRRYELYFAVNGGAFAIVSFWARTPAGEAALKTLADPAGAPVVAAADRLGLFGMLTAQQVGWGMAAFCAIMFFDIWAFGWKHRAESGGELFRVPGWLVLGGIATLLISGWTLAMNLLPGWPPLLAVGCVVALVAALAGLSTFLIGRGDRTAPTATPPRQRRR